MKKDKLVRGVALLELTDQLLTYNMANVLVMEHKLHLLKYANSFTALPKKKKKIMHISEKHILYIFDKIMSNWPVMKQYNLKKIWWVKYPGKLKAGISQPFYDISNKVDNTWNREKRYQQVMFESMKEMVADEKRRGHPGNRNKSALNMWLNIQTIS